MYVYLNPDVYSPLSPDARAYTFSAGDVQEEKQSREYTMMITGLVLILLFGATLLGSYFFGMYRNQG